MRLALITPRHISSFLETYGAAIGGGGSGLIQHSGAAGKVLQLQSFIPFLISKKTQAAFTARNGMMGWKGISLPKLAKQPESKLLIA